MKKIKWLQLVVLFFISTNTVCSQNHHSGIKTIKVKDNIYMLQGAGGNIGVFVGEDGVFMIDDKFDNLTADILEAIKEITNEPVAYLVNTHWHGDHTGGNENMEKEGAIIISHENVRKRMSVDNIVRGKLKKAAPKGALPILTFTKDMFFHLNGEDILVSHVHNAHTDGDAHIYFTNANVIHMGDTYFQGKFPYIDVDSGGSIDGYIEAVEKAIRIADDETIIIPGHFNLSNKKELLVFKEMLVTLRNRVAAKIEEGKTLKEVKNDVSITKEYEKEYSFSFINAEKIRTIIYNSLKNKN